MYRHGSILAATIISMAGCNYSASPNAPLASDKGTLYFALDTSSPPHEIFPLGSYEVTVVTSSKISFAASAGILCDPILFDRETNNFNFDGLYRASINGKNYYFRFGQQDCTTGTTTFRSVQWANNLVPPPGQFSFSVVSKEIMQSGISTVAMVGDSITWWNYGESLRARLDQLRPEFIFTGSRTDTYGYGHEGEGGNSSLKVIERIPWIVPADFYILLIGTNDRGTDDETLLNIKTITASLQAKANSTVYVCTLLPRQDAYDDRNIRISQAIRDWIAAEGNSALRIIDIDADFRAIPNWQTLLIDSVHPDDAGYNILANIISSSV